MDCKEPIPGARSLKTVRCKVCDRENKRKVDKEYRETHKRPCDFCGQPVVVSHKHDGVVHCTVCGEDGKKRKKKYSPKGVVMS